MQLNDIRAFLKKHLKRTPFFKMARLIHHYVKISLDKRVFQARYPNADIVNFSSAALNRQKDEGFSSQYGQDYYLWHKVFQHKERGTFIDIGCNEPLIISNSLFLEQQGWTGYAFDPISRFEKAWKDNRKAQFFKAAISDSRETRPFVEILASDGWEPALSGFDGFVREEDIALFDHKRYDVEAKPLRDFIPDQTKVDILMIDVEGAEELVLKGIDFSLLRPIYVMIENVSVIGGDEKIRNMMEESGYAIIARVSATDDLFELK